MSPVRSWRRSRRPRSRTPPSARCALRQTTRATLTTTRPLTRSCRSARRSKASTCRTCLRSRRTTQRSPLMPPVPLCLQRHWTNRGRMPWRRTHMRTPPRCQRPQPWTCWPLTLQRQQPTLRATPRKRRAHRCWRRMALLLTMPTRRPPTPAHQRPPRRPTQRATPRKTRAWGRPRRRAPPRIRPWPSPQPMRSWPERACHSSRPPAQRPQTTAQPRGTTAPLQSHRLRSRPQTPLQRCRHQNKPPWKPT
mmetsp:Transcript_45125/g.116930  ORF Transcript_45125/g.116930 Transcript_45125/m.116930 type:complete len:250 (-) Transcript_45125:1074-1823(-)